MTLHNGFQSKGFKNLRCCYVSTENVESIILIRRCLEIFNNVKLKSPRPLNWHYFNLKLTLFNKDFPLLSE